MKRMILLALFSVLLLFSSCTRVATPLAAPATMVPGVDAELPEAEPPAEMNRQETAALYFRYSDEPYLAAEYRVITQAVNKPYEQALLTALISGTASHDLTSLFPTGVQVISTTRQGRTLFVTLSQEIMNPYADEINTTYSTSEAILRRKLCMQSIVATVTENCDVDQVQVLVQQDTAMTGSLRLDKRYFLNGETGLTDPLTRDESLLLTPHNTLNLILQLCRQQDWTRMYNYLVRMDTDTGTTRPAYADFVDTMEALPALTEYASSIGSVSLYGQTVTFAVDATLRLSDGSVIDKTNRILRLEREDGLWRISAEHLIDWMEVSP